MTPEQWQKIRPIIESALELNPADRPAFLEGACPDVAIRREVESLIASPELRSNFLESPAVEQVIAIQTTGSVAVWTAGMKLGSYEIKSLLGAGGMGEVYRARDLSLKREVAIKIIPHTYSSDPARLHRFKQEAEVTAALNHPNILTIFQVGQHESTYFIVAELLQGDTLRERLKKGPLAIQPATDYGVQIVRGLAAAHQRGIVHRDLKPENIFVTRDGRIKILDFGLAKLTEHQHYQPEKDGHEKSITRQWTEPGLVLGTTAYMSPEQVRGVAVDHRSDIFAFGAVLYEMLTGCLAFAKTTAAETMTAILNEDPPVIPQSGHPIPPGMQRVIHRCLEKNPEQRFQSASDLAFALETLSDSGSSPAVTSDSSAISPRVWLAAGAVAVIVAAVVAFFWWRIPAAVPVVESMIQLTDDDEVKVQGAEMATDGTRVYFTEKYAGSFRLAQVVASGGPVAPVPTQITGAYSASMAPDFSGLLVVENPQGRHPLWFQPLPGGDPRRMGTLESQGAIFTLDGKQVVYTDGNTINVADRDGTNARKIADLPGIGYFPAISPDGTEIRVTIEAGDGASLWAMRSDGIGLHRLATTGPDLTEAGYGRWTPDGRHFVFHASHEGRTDIWAISENPGFLHKSNLVPMQLTNGPLSCNLATPSRDGKQIFARCAKLRGELVRYDRKLNQFIPFLGGISATDVAFSRTGAWVAYLSYPDQSLWRMRADGRDRARLSYPPMVAGFPEISPDGTRIVFAQWKLGLKSDLYSVEMGGRTPQKIVDEATDCFGPSWSPDGHFLAFNVALPVKHTEQALTEIGILDLRSGKVSVLPQSQGKGFPVWVDQELLVATANDSSKVFRYDVKTQAWSDLGNGPYSDCSATDGKYVYCTTAEPARPAAVRIRVSDARVEKLADLSGLNRILTTTSRELSLTLAGDLLFTRDIGTQEIYALNVRWP
jgi:serine/threonine protein kinase/Tol biopolymer transport system component